MRVAPQFNRQPQSLRQSPTPRLLPCCERRSVTVAARILMGLAKLVMSRFQPFASPIRGRGSRGRTCLPAPCTRRFDALNDAHAARIGSDPRARSAAAGVRVSTPSAIRPVAPSQRWCVGGAARRLFHPYRIAREIPSNYAVLMVSTAVDPVTDHSDIQHLQRNYNHMTRTTRSLPIAAPKCFISSDPVRFDPRISEASQ